jgi:type I restriction enzyme M protein
VLSKVRGSKEIESLNFYFEKPPLDKVLRVFAECHNYIWKADKRSPSSAFMEFVKIMFVKLWADRELRKDRNIINLLHSGTKVPKASVTFSAHWIESREKETPNPIDEVWFKQLRNSIEEEISRKRKKRVFEKDEHINLRPQTTKEVVKRLEHYDMFAIDEDLNGRLFETFLNATMRGKELVQNHAAFSGIERCDS